MNKISYIITIIFALSLVFTSCKKEEDDPEETNNPAVTTKDLSLHFSALFGDTDFEYNETYTLNGVDVKFQEIRYYLSNFEVADAAGGSAVIEEVLLIDAGTTEQIDLVKLNESFTNIEDINFNLGLDYDTNHADPTLAEAPLNDGTMHWGWNPDAGYKFVKIEGTRDLNGDGEFVPFSIHVAEDTSLRAIEKTIGANFADNNLMLHFMIDYKVWFDNIDLSAETLTGTHGNSAFTNAIVDQYETSLSIMN